MVHKITLTTAISLAAIATIVNAQAPAPTFQFKETYPEPFVVPTPKQEWLDLIKNATIANAPVLTVDANGSPAMPAGQQGDPYCVWTFTNCLGPDDLYTCPPGQWGLTFDDGPSEFSGELYDYLDRINKKATFYMVGGQVVRFPALAKRAYDAGHEIAMHTWSHSYMTTLTNEQIVAELKWTEQAIKEVTGVSPKYFRPPFGNIDNRVRDIAKALGFTAVIWSVDTNDWYLQSDPTFNPAWITGNVSSWASTAATQGGVSLSHDLYNQTVKAALEYIPTLNEAFALKTVGQCNNQVAYKEGAGNVNVTGPAVSASASVPASSAVVSSSKVAPGASPSSSTVGKPSSDQQGAAARASVMSTAGFLLVFTAAAALMSF
ncbi:hypothetical protein BX666DRAFT_2031564 [Dichotomocladium elegans]|nr:hypothetical protein BX666DRAFT_2031564 [Dichotomocladium elegans]